MEMFKTGGGTAKIQPLTTAEEMLLSLLPSTIQGLPSVFDSDKRLGINNNIYMYIIYNNL